VRLSTSLLNWRQSRPFFAQRSSRIESQAERPAAMCLSGSHSWHRKARTCRSPSDRCASRGLSTSTRRVRCLRWHNCRLSISDQF
jgi:hypothetical protein